jgi:amino acid transporter
VPLKASIKEIRVSGPNPVDFLTDPLSQITRVERRNLLIASTTGFLVATADLVPTEISALGISLSAPAQEMFVILVSLTIAYFLCAFLVYGISDYFIWRKKYQDYLEAVQEYMENWTPEDQHNYDMSQVPRVPWLYQRAGLVAYIRAFFEYLLPILISVGAVGLLLFRVYCP